MPNDKGLDRGGTLGQEGDLTPEGDSPAPRRPNREPRGSLRDRLDHRDQEKQRGGIGHEPSLDEKRDIQPTHPVD